MERSRDWSSISGARGSSFKFYSTITAIGCCRPETEIRFLFNQQSNPYDAKVTLCNKVLSLGSSATPGSPVSSRMERRQEEGADSERKVATSRLVRRGWLREIKVAGCDWSFILQQGRKVRLGNAYVREENAERRRAEVEMKPLRVKGY